MNYLINKNKYTARYKYYSDSAYFNHSFYIPAC